MKPNTGCAEMMGNAQGRSSDSVAPPATPTSSATSSQKSTCLRRKKKSRSRVYGSDGSAQADFSSQESDWEITKRLDFDDMDLSDGEQVNENQALADEKERQTAKKSRAKTPAKQSVTPVVNAAVSAPIRNTCILESPLDHKRSQRKRRVYGIRRDEPQLPRKRRKRSAKRAMPFAICSLQRMFAQ